MPRSNTLHYTSGRLGARRLRCGRRDTSSSSSLSLLVALSAASRRQHRVGLGPSDVAPTAAPRRSALWRRRLLLKARARQQEMQLLVPDVQAISAERTARGPGHCVPQLGDVRGHSVEPEPPAVPALAPRPVAARPALPLGRHAAQRRGGGIFKRGQAGCAELRWLRRRQPAADRIGTSGGARISDQPLVAYHSSIATPASGAAMQPSSQRASAVAAPSSRLRTA